MGRSFSERASPGEISFRENEGEKHGQVDHGQHRFACAGKPGLKGNVKKFSQSQAHGQDRKDKGRRAKAPVDDGIAGDGAQSAQPVGEYEVAFAQGLKGRVEDFILIGFPGEQVGNAGYEDKDSCHHHEHPQ